MNDAIEQDRQALRDALTYRSYDHDLWEIVFDDTDRPMFAEANEKGLPLYTVGADFVLDCYYERGALEPLVTMYSRHCYRSAAHFDRLLEQLVAAGRTDLIARLWTGIVRQTRAEYIREYPRDASRDYGAFQVFEKYTFEAYAHAIDWLTRIGEQEAAARLAAERDTLRDSGPPSLPSPTDLRRIDEEVFWELIRRARDTGETAGDRLDALGALLRGFKAPEIKRFGSRYAKLMKRLYHWNAWALAYAARGGCSDDAFEEFRAWLILQGDPELLELAISDPTRAAARVPKNPDLPDGPGLSVIEEAYLERSGNALELPAIDLEKPKGREWNEDRFEQEFPELVRYYASAMAE